MNYSIGEVSRMFGLPQSTLRYYDKEGLLPYIQRQGAGIRRFDEQAVEALRVIECLKKSGMEIKDIRQFMIWCGEGASTYQQRLELFQRRRAEVARLKKTLAMIDFKCWYYTQALATGSEDFTAAIPEGLPEEIRSLYDASHGEESCGKNGTN